MNNISQIKHSIDNYINNNVFINSFKKEKIIINTWFINNLEKIIPSIVIILILIIYFYYFYNRIPRYLNKLKVYNKILYIAPVSNFKKLISKKYRLSDFYIASSYKSYLPCKNYYDYSSCLAIEAAILYGARFIDIDVFNKDFNHCTEPVVCNGNEKGNWHWTTEISFDNVCDTISKIAFSNYISNGTDPLFLNINLNINSNIYTANKIADILEKHFSQRLLPRKFAYQGYNKNPDLFVNIAQSPIKELLGKIIIICNDGFQNSKLDELVNISTSKNQNYRELTYSQIKDSYDSSELINFNKTSLSKVIFDKQSRNKENYNYYTPMINAGCQFVCMDYFYPDDWMISYITQFKECSFILKPYLLRYQKSYIPYPKKQNRDLSFSPNCQIIEGTNELVCT